jgi:hypothetical protein
MKTAPARDSIDKFEPGVRARSKPGVQTQWPLNILITKVEVETEPPLAVWQVEVYTNDGTWMEAFKTDAELACFLRGVQVACSMIPGGKLLPDLGDQPMIKFDPKSEIQNFP